MQIFALGKLTWCKWPFGGGGGGLAGRERRAGASPGNLPPPPPLGTPPDWLHYGSMTIKLHKLCLLRPSYSLYWWIPNTFVWLLYLVSIPLLYVTMSIYRISSAAIYQTLFDICIWFCKHSLDVLLIPDRGRHNCVCVCVCVCILSKYTVFEL